MTFRKLAYGASVAAIMMSASTAVFAQETTGGIRGVVTDASGYPVSGATVTVTSGQGAKTFTTDSSGRFYAPFLTPGSYAVKVELSGFTPVEQREVLNPQTATVDLVVDRARSTSYVAAAGDAVSEQVARDVRAIVERFDEPFEYPYVTQIFTCRRS